MTRKEKLNYLTEMKERAFEELLDLYHGELSCQDIVEEFIKIQENNLKQTQSDFEKSIITQGLKEAKIKNQTLGGFIICLYKPVLTRKEQNTICEIYTQKIS